MTEHMEKSILKFATTGSVDDGKSTLIGRLLYETNCIYEDQYEAIQKTSHRIGKEQVDLALLLDGLAAEREQGITIDVAYRYFTTPRRKFIIADSPGHTQYTKNMFTGASNADAAIILIDASRGILTQSKRHGFLISLLQIPHLIVAVNKMDLVGYSKEEYEQIVEQYSLFSEKLDIHDITYIPVSALKGDNVITKSQNMAWYDGPALLHILENINITADRNLVDFRFPVQYVLRPDSDFRGFAGTIYSGTINPGEELIILPSGKRSKLKFIYTYDGELKEAFLGQSVVLVLEDEIDISRGDMIVRRNNLPQISNKFDAIICWMDDRNISLKDHYILKHTTNNVKAYVNKIHYKIDINTLHRKKATKLSLNDICRIEIRTTSSIFFDSYRINRKTGCFILIDPKNNNTVAAGVIRGIYKEFDQIMHEEKKASIKSKHISQEKTLISLKQWEEINRHKAAVIWLTGLSGSGKSTIAINTIKELFDMGCQVMLLDGDNLRHGLNSDLGFSAEDRSENIRRVGEVARLFFGQGNIVICSFISPFKEDRDFARSLIPDYQFFEIFVKCNINTCKKRDPKGLYKKAETGEIIEFTGVSSPYEKPETPELIIETDMLNINQSILKVMELLKKHEIIKK